MNFYSLLEKSIRKRESLLCVGIDPQGEFQSGEELYPWCKNIILSTSEFAACFKVNIAFFETFGADGYRSLERVIKLIPADVPVIMDAKRGDIGNTAKAYSRALFEKFRVHAVTLNPYLGRESIDPFLSWSDKGLFVLCRTSNPGSDKFQEILTKDEIPYYRHVAREVLQWGNNVGLVVAGNLPGVIKEIREQYPDIWILAPGFGSQGGDIHAAVQAGLREDGLGLILNVSRSIAQASDPSKAAEEFRDKINRCRGGGRMDSSTALQDPDNRRKRDLIRRLVQTDCFRIGEFKLKSGEISPFYIDLRLIISYPGLLDQVASAYTELLSQVEGTRLAGIPLAAVPFATAVSQKTNMPMIVPRMEKKGHGTGKPVEGVYAKGDRVILLDDVITTGGSKLEAARLLREEGLIVEDLLVLIERGRSGREQLDQAGIRLHRYLDVSEILTECVALGKISPNQLNEFQDYLKES